MKCPKCGQEYEGSACPNCEPGPEIIVNNADYLRRKEAYEKKQAEKESASSHTDKPQKEPEEENADDRREKRSHRNSRSMRKSIIWV